MTRIAGYEPGGREFESLRARHKHNILRIYCLPKPLAIPAGVYLVLYHFTTHQRSYTTLPTGRTLPDCYGGPWCPWRGSWRARLGRNLKVDRAMIESDAL